MNRIRKKRLIVPAAVVAVLLLGGCAGQAEPPADTTTPAPSTSPPATPEPTDSATTPPAEPAAEPLVIPECDALVPVEEFRAYDRWSKVELHDSLDTPSVVEELPGDRAKEVAGTATQAYGCQWAVPQSSTGLEMYVLQITPDARDALIADLRAAPEEYTETSWADAPSFWIQLEEGLGGTTVTYSFVGDAWVIQRGAMIDSQTAEWSVVPALTNLRAANPGLDGR